MTAETTTETFTAEVPVEAAYAQLVSFQEAAGKFREAYDAEDKDGQIDAANAAIDSCIDLINQVVTGEVSEKLHARLEAEHPELVPPVEDTDLAAIIEALTRALSSGDDF